MIPAPLRDPTVSLAYWLPQYDTWADQDGRAVSLPGPNEPRSVTLIDSEGEHLAALVHDPSLDDEPELLEAVGAAAGIALEKGRLQVELKAKLQELEGSRERVIEAGQQERAARAQPSRRRPAALGRALARTRGVRHAARQRS